MNSALRAYICPASKTVVRYFFLRVLLAVVDYLFRWGSWIRLVGWLLGLLFSGGLRITAGGLCSWSIFSGELNY